MATNLSWVTPPGSLANFAIGRTSIIDVVAVDTENTDASITYAVISGTLPPGLILTNLDRGSVITDPSSPFFGQVINHDYVAEIAGIPEYSDPNNTYFIRQDYEFVVRARTSNNRTIDGRFRIFITNTVNQDFNWVTPSGTLGTVPNGQFYSLKIEAYSAANLGVTYSFVSGELPPGMQLISNQVNKTISSAQSVANNILNLNNTQTVSINDYVFGNNIPVATRVTNVNGTTNTVTVSTNTLEPLSVGQTVRFFSPGYLQGVPTILDPIAVNESRLYRFTIRATNSIGHINDRAFSLNITNINGPIIEPQTEFLGSYFDGTFFSKQLELIQLNPAVEVDWLISSGELPPGLSISQTGVISGYLTPVDLTGEFGPGGYDGEEITDSVVSEQQGYDIGPYQFNQQSLSKAYTFTVQAYDGANYDLQTYVLNVVSTPSFTVDNTDINVDDDFLTIDYGNVYVPVLRNPITVLPAGRQASYYAFKFDGYDFGIQGNSSLTYSLVNTDGTFDGNIFDPLWNVAFIDNFNPRPANVAGGFDAVSTTASNLPGVELDAETGWLYGLLSNVNSALETFTFGVQASKTEGNIVYSSAPKYFTLPVIGDPNSTVAWITDSDLGIIDNGTVSDLSLEAISAVGKDLTYRLIDRSGVSCRLPQGLKLLPSGEISGRATFEAFTLDDYTTTFDNETLTIDRTCTFAVRAEAVDGTSSADRTFTLTLNIIDTEPYENLYLQAMPTVAQRQRLNSLLNDTSIFDPNLIYRATDPNFGIQENLKMLFLWGLTPSQLTEYQVALTENHFNKTYNFGEVKTAYVLDETFNIKYEVVYVEMIDPGENINNEGPPLSLDLSGIISNPYIGQTGEEYFVIYPNSSENMRKRVETDIGYQDQSSLPAWMTSNQPDPNTVTGFTTPLGYTKACVLAYATRGDGEKIAYRIKKSGFDFNNINFVVDRYQIDNFYSKFYNTQAQTYIQDRETTFDSDSNLNVGSIVATVSYAVVAPFSDINGRPISYIQQTLNGIDGVTNFREGDTLIFIRQENFEVNLPYDGWVDYSNSYIGDNTETDTVEGFDSSSFDTYSIIPGFLEKSQLISPINYRGGVWRITITNNIVNLVFERELQVNDRVKILFGKTFSGAVVFYSIDLSPGQTVPFYKIFTSTPVVGRRTTFNNDTTKFFTYRDSYYEPGEQDKYIKFPQYGAFE
jgi:hypothetical protein